MNLTQEMFSIIVVKHTRNWGFVRKFDPIANSLEVHRLPPIAAKLQLRPLYFMASYMFSE